MTNMCKVWGYHLVCSEQTVSVMYKFGAEGKENAPDFLSFFPLVHPGFSVAEPVKYITLKGYASTSILCPMFY